MVHTANAIVLEHWRQEGIPNPEQEYRFHPTRRWRADFAWPDAMVMLEVEGGIWQQGRHTRPQGFTKDLDKYNTATAMGWALIRCLPSTICGASTVSHIRRLLLATEIRDHPTTRARKGSQWVEVIRRYADEERSR